MSWLSINRFFPPQILLSEGEVKGSISL